MNKKFILSLFVAIALIFSFTFVNATDGLQSAANGVKNVVGNAENGVENAAKGITNTSEDATSHIEGTMNNSTTDNYSGNTKDSTTTGLRNDSNYNATRTATARTTAATDNGTLFGMNSTAWTWVILAIAAIVIVALVWYYGSQRKNDNYHSGDNY